MIVNGGLPERAVFFCVNTEINKGDNPLT